MTFTSWPMQIALMLIFAGADVPQQHIDVYKLAEESGQNKQANFVLFIIFIAKLFAFGISV